MAHGQDSRVDRPVPQGADALGTAHIEDQETSRIMEIKGVLGLPIDRPLPMNPAEIHCVDDLQDELMARRSPEGRPPRHDLRIAEWKWLMLAIGFVLVCVMMWAVSQGMEAVWIVIGAVFLVLMAGIGISPVLYAGLLRGGEEHDARKTAAAVVKHDASLKPH